MLKENQIAVVVPTIRPASLKAFMVAWSSIFKESGAQVLVVKDGVSPSVSCNGETYGIPKELKGVIFNHNDGVRNLGFYYAAQLFPACRYIVTLDDDVTPYGVNPVLDHVAALNMKVPISWMAVASEYTRGFPYGVRDEAEVYASHGVWEGVKDYDAPTQLVKGNMPVHFYRGSVPRGALIPLCGMNFAFRREALPYVYFAPMGERVGVHRFADIWMGILLKRHLDQCNQALVTGFSTVHHSRASNVFKNLQQEARGITLNESFWCGESDDAYFGLYAKCRKQWQERTLSLAKLS